ncbi:MAG TPA: sulfotransferase, partial [Caulobacteraceae bacterium]|nr:sulfotransferase [Caulobacteraceae bacterium]
LRAVGMAGAPAGRNDPCPCGSGRKYKQCCADKDRAAAAARERVAAEVRRGLALERRGRIEEAMAAYHFIADAAPEARSRMGHLLVALGRRAEAIAAFRAAAAGGDTTERRMDLVRALLTENRGDEAEPLLRRITADDPASADAWWMLAHVRTEAGDFGEATEALERSLALQPHQGGAWYDLARSRRLTEADRPLIARMQAAVRGLTVADERVKLNLALGKAFDDLGDAGAAMKHFTEAGRIKGAIAPFDRAHLARHVDALIDRFTPDFLAAHAAGGDPSPLPVMVVGLPRSGTTLVEQVLSSHGAVAGAGELQFWLERDPLVVNTATPAAIADLQARTARACLDHLRALAPEAARVIDKNPFNLFRLGLVHLAFPRATIIHCRRQPIDTCLSILATYFQPRADFPAEPGDLVFYHRLCDRLADHWRAVLPPGRFVDIDYEDLVAEPEPVGRRLVAALDLPWDAACLRPELNPRVVRTSSRWQVRQPIHRGAVDRWRRYEPWLGELRALAPD